MRKNIPGLTYWLHNKLYLAVTNRTISLSPIQLRGPSFILPPSSKFEPLHGDFEPSAQDLFDAVDNAYEDGLVEVNSMKSDEITFAGMGEPLLRTDTIEQAAKLIKEARHGVPLRIKTNGLIPARQASEVIHYRKLNFT